MRYIEKLQRAAKEAQSLLCVGLDPDVQKIRECFSSSSSLPDDELVIRFCHEVIEHTHSYACAFKPNLAFFEALGKNGLSAFKRVIDAIPNGKIIIADAKRGDIGNTASHYAKAFFEEFYVDALTINPLMGLDTVEPYCNYEGKAVYVLTLTSNPGANHYFQQSIGSQTLSEKIAADCAELQENAIAHIGLVVGATYDSNLVQNILQQAPNQSLLIPGIGAQGGSVQELKSALKYHKGFPIINSSRNIIYAGKGIDWAHSVRSAAEETRESLRELTELYVV